MVTVGTGGIGTRFIKTDYPFEYGLSGGTYRQRDDYKLEYEESTISDEEGL